MFHLETYAVPFKRFLFVNLIFTYKYASNKNVEHKIEV